MVEPLLVGVRDAAGRLGLGRDATYALVREGRLRSVHVNRRVLIPVTELEAFVTRELDGGCDGASLRPVMHESPRRGPRATGTGQGESYPASPTEVDELLTVARDYQKAARQIADDETLTIRAKCLGLLELNRRARREVLPEFAASAVWGGSRHLFVEDKSVPNDVIDAIRRLLRRSLSACPTCRRPLPDHEQLDSWVALRHGSYRRSA